MMQEAKEFVQENVKFNPNYDPEIFENVADICGITTDKLLTAAMEVESMDNLSVVILSFANFTKYLGSIK